MVVKEGNIVAFIALCVRFAAAARAVASMAVGIVHGRTDVGMGVGDRTRVVGVMSSGGGVVIGGGIIVIVIGGAIVVAVIITVVIVVIQGHEVGKMGDMVKMLMIVVITVVVDTVRHSTH